MPTFTELPSGKIRVQVRKRGIYRAATFATKREARDWATTIESQAAHIVAGGFAVVLAVRLGRMVLTRRRRGRWGTLQDRFAVLAARRGASASSPNPTLATAWTGDDDLAVARLVAERLDQFAFDPMFVDDDSVFIETRKLVGALRTDHR